jgi:hypothetical protein
MLLILGLVVLIIESNAEPQYMDSPDPYSYFRSAAIPHSSFGLKSQENPKQLLLQADARTFFTVTLTVNFKNIF